MASNLNQPASDYPRSICLLPVAAAGAMDAAVRPVRVSLGARVDRVGMWRCGGWGLRFAPLGAPVAAAAEPDLIAELKSGDSPSGVTWWLAPRDPALSINGLRRCPWRPWRPATWWPLARDIGLSPCCGSPSRSQPPSRSRSDRVRFAVAH